MGGLRSGLQDASDSAYKSMNRYKWYRPVLTRPVIRRLCWSTISMGSSRNCGWAARKKRVNSQTMTCEGVCRTPKLYTLSCASASPISGGNLEESCIWPLCVCHSSNNFISCHTDSNAILAMSALPLWVKNPLECLRNLYDDDDGTLGS